jgi:pimeloyl-ACP methyl ester carboxylesterase
MAMLTTAQTRHGQLALSREGAGPAVMLLHGVPGSAATWSQVAVRLAPEADVIVPDLLGFGGSARPRDLQTLHAVSQAEALLDALDAQEVPTATVVGHDFGGPVALSLLAMAPERVSSLGLLATNAFPDTPIPFPLSTIFWPVFGRLAAAGLFSRPSLRLMLRTGVGSPRVRLDPAAHLADADQVRAVRTIFEGSLRHLTELFSPVEIALETADVPGFVLWGDRDPFFTIESGKRTAAAFGVPLTRLDGAGHFLPEERPEEVAQAVLSLHGQVQTTSGRR